jgi:hypothetical protein
MKHILLLGAGFSRNWGGWLASEVFEYLLGHPNIMINNDLKQLLWNNQSKGGFEEALAELQGKADLNITDRKNLESLELAISDMFNEMNNAFSKIIDWDLQGPNKSIGKSINDFLEKFDAIYSLNQDLLLEYHYIESSNKGRLRHIKIHGAKVENPFTPTHEWALSKLSAEITNNVPTNFQPIYKLHGSSNWVDSNGKPLLVLGGKKNETISKLSILSNYQKQFAADLNILNTRLMIIGYGFGDVHINDSIVSGMLQGLEVLNINPSGIEQLLTLFNSPASTKLQNQIIGASRRNLHEIFGNDTLEYSKILRFFKS